MKHLAFIGYYLLSLLSFGQADTSRILNDLKQLTGTQSFRHFMNPKTLDSVATYIYDQLKTYADTVYYQEFTVNGVTYRNVVGVFGFKKPETVVLGAHYDVCGMQEGADDNASGVAGLLELSRLLSGKELKNRIELVAYTLEEPPYFRTEHMGSYHHAQALAQEGRDVKGMISLEMIGYYDDRKRSQDYPLGFLKLFYGSRGNYIALVNKTGKGSFARKFTKRFKKYAEIKAKSITAPKAIPGIDFSDHLNYWHLGFSALMITDTAFYRNKNYHEETDTLETLSIPNMAQVVDGIYSVLLR